MRFPEKCQRVPDISNHICLIFRCVRWRPEHLAAEHNGRTFYQNQRARGDLGKMKYNRSLSAHVRTKKTPLKLISSISETFIFYFPAFIVSKSSSICQLKHHVCEEIFSIFKNKCPLSLLCLWVWRRTQENEEKGNKTLRSKNAIRMTGGLRRAVRGAEMIQHSGSRGGRAPRKIGTNNHVLQGIQAFREAFKEF